MIAAISPAAINYEESLSTLQYAARAKTIVNKARVNEDENAAVIRALRKEVLDLKAQLALAGGGGAGGGAEAAAAALAATREAERLKAELEENKKRMEELNSEWQLRVAQTQDLQREMQLEFEQRQQEIQERERLQRERDIKELQEATAAERQGAGAWERGRGRAGEACAACDAMTVRRRGIWRLFGFFLFESLLKRLAPFRRRWQWRLRRAGR